jgi:hypothetical protein
VTYSLSGGRGVNLSFYGQTYANYYANLNIAWKVLNKISLSTPFRWEQGTDLYGAPDTFNQFQTGITLGRGLTERLSGSVGYRLVVRNSEENGGDYVANSVSLNFSYRF